MTTSLYIFYCGRSIKDNKNKKRIIKKNKKEEVTRRFCKLIGQKEKKTFFLINLLGDILDLSEEE